MLGLQLDEGRTFIRLLEEVTLPLGRGDLFVLYTDGLSEAMNGDGDCFGDARLAEPGRPACGSRRRRAARADPRARSTRSPAPPLQQDDMTMVLLRVEQVGAALSTPALAHADA